MKKTILSFIFLLAISFYGIAQTAITFVVDMRAETVSPDGVHITGSFQGWDPASAAHELTDDDGNGIYNLTLDIEPGDHLYKLVNGTVLGKDGGENEGYGPDGGLEDCGQYDGFDGYNRQLAVDTGEDKTVNLIYNSCTPLDLTSTDKLEDLDRKMDISAKPNPFNSFTTITFTSYDDEEVTIAIYNLIGQQVATLVQERVISGTYSIQWDGTADNGASLPNGQYFYVLESAKQSIAKRIMISK